MSQLLTVRVLFSFIGALFYSVTSVLPSLADTQIPTNNNQGGPKAPIQSDLNAINPLERILFLGNNFTQKAWINLGLGSAKYDNATTSVIFKDKPQIQWQKFVLAHGIICPNIATTNTEYEYIECLTYHGYHIDRAQIEENTLTVYISEHVAVNDATVSDFETNNTNLADYQNFLLHPYSGPNLNPGQLSINLKEFRYKKIGYEGRANFFKNEDETYDITLDAKLHDDKISATTTYDMSRNLGVSASARLLTNIIAPGTSAVDVVYYSGDNEIFTSLYTPLHQFDFSTLEATASYSDSSILEAHNVELASLGLKHAGRIYRYSDPGVFYTQKLHINTESVKNNLIPSVNYAKYGLSTVFKNKSNKEDKFEINLSVISNEEDMLPVLSYSVNLKSVEKFQYDDIGFKINTGLTISALSAKFSEYPISERLSLGGEDTFRGVSNSLFGSREDPKDTGAEFVTALQNELEFPFNMKKKHVSIGLLNDYGFVDRGRGSGEILVSAGIFGRYQINKNVIASLTVAKNFNVDQIFHVGFSLKTLF